MGERGNKLSIYKGFAISCVFTWYLKTNQNQMPKLPWPWRAGWSGQDVVKVNIGGGSFIFTYVLLPDKSFWSLLIRARLDLCAQFFSPCYLHQMKQGGGHKERAPHNHTELHSFPPCWVADGGKKRRQETWETQRIDFPILCGRPCSGDKEISGRCCLKGREKIRAA